MKTTTTTRGWTEAELARLERALVEERALAVRRRDAFQVGKVDGELARIHQARCAMGGAR